jgi:hypothetical protein
MTSKMTTPVLPETTETTINLLEVLKPYHSAARDEHWNILLNSIASRLNQVEGNRPTEFKELTEKICDIMGHRLLHKEEGFFVPTKLGFDLNSLKNIRELEETIKGDRCVSPSSKAFQMLTVSIHLFMQANWNKIIRNLKWKGLSELARSPIAIIVWYFLEKDNDLLCSEFRWEPEMEEIESIKHDWQD